MSEFQIVSEIPKTVDNVVVELARQNFGRVNSATTIQTPLNFKGLDESSPVRNEISNGSSPIAGRINLSLI